MIQVTLIMQQYEGEAVTELRTFLDQEALDKHIDDVLSAPYQGLHIKNVTSYGASVDPQYRAKDDIHMARACLLFDKKAEDISCDERQIAKKAFYICMVEFAGLAPIAVENLFKEVHKRSEVVIAVDHGKREAVLNPKPLEFRCECSFASYQNPGCPGCR